AIAELCEFAFSTYRNSVRPAIAKTSVAQKAGRLLNRLVFKPTQLPFWGLASVLAFSVFSRAETPLPQKERLRTSPVLRHLKPNPAAPPKNPVRSEERR